MKMCSSSCRDTTNSYCDDQGVIQIWNMEWIVRLNMMSLKMVAKRKTSVSFPFQQTQLSHFHDHLDIVQPSCGNKSRNISNETLQCFPALCVAAKPHDCQARRLPSKNPPSYTTVLFEIQPTKLSNFLDQWLIFQPSCGDKTANV